MAWLHEHTPDDTARFVLGTDGANPLICFGVNPSTARPGDLDRTVARVEKIAVMNGYDSFIMLNVYPQRATDPFDLHDIVDPVLAAENALHITTVLDRFPFSRLLAAWGVVIDDRAYLRELLRGILALPAVAGRDWLSLGTTKCGHPRHPSRISPATALASYLVDHYR